MKKAHVNSIIITVFILPACTVLYSTQEYVITAGNEQVRFVPPGICELLAHRPRKEHKK